MTPIDRFERDLPIALADLADEPTPDYFIDILGQTARSRQRPAWAIPGRWFQMPGLASRPAFAALVVAVVVILGGVLLMGRGSNQSVGAPSTAPSSSAQPSPSTASAGGTSGGFVPEGLRVPWLLRSADPASHPASAPMFLFGQSSILAPYASVTDPSPLDSDVGVTGADTLELRSTAVATGCTSGDLGHYRWSLSSSGTTLDLTQLDDACAARAAALPSGSWARIACRTIANGCYGDLEAGTYASQYVNPRRAADVAWKPEFGDMSFSVPAGWSNSKDDADSFTLTPSADYALETSDGPPAGTWREISMKVAPAANRLSSDCASSEDRSIKPTVDGLVSYVQGLKSLTTSDAHDITVGGHKGRWLDIQIAPSWTGTCPDVPAGTAASSILVRAGDPEGYSFGLNGAERARLVFVDIGGGDTVVFIVDSSDPARFDQLATDAMPIIESFTFR
jgi:hypothetical protein